MTTLTTPEDSDNDYSEHPDSDAATPMIAAATEISRATCRFMSTYEVGHVDGDGARWAAGRAGAAIPALVDMHEGFAGVGVDGQRVQRTNLNAQGAALDTQGLVDGHRYIGAVVDQRHGLLLIRLPRMVIRSPRIRIYSRSTGLPSSRLVSRSNMSNDAPSGTCSVAAECASAGRASSASDAEPSRCPLTCSMSAKRSLVSSGWSRIRVPMSGDR